MAWNKTGGQAAKLLVDSDGIISQSNDDEPVKPEPYNIRMLFGATEHLANDKQVFDVYVQDNLVRKNLTLGDVEINGNAGNSLELQNLSVGEDLHIRFGPKAGNVVLAGIELVRQQGKQ